MTLLGLAGVDKFFGAEQILTDVSFRIDRGDRVALIGSNGAGKSTILRIIAGEEEPDAGSVSLTRNVRVVYLPQEPDFHAQATLYEVLLDAFREAIEAQGRLRALEQQMASGDTHADLIEEYGRLQALVEHAGYDYREQIERVLTGLELPQDTWHLAVEKLSGGQRTRANLARTLLQDGDILLLDEPTNHLDIPAVEWLEGYLRDIDRAFIIVAHDRYLLDRVTKRTLELSFGRLTEYDAPYTRYLELRAERTERRRIEYAAQREQIARTEDFVRRYGAGQRSKEARGRQKRLDRLERIERPQDEEEVRLRLSRPHRSGEIVLTLNQLRVGYPGNPLVKLPREVVVRRGEHIALIGPNGSGKTTLLRTLIGSLEPIEGEVKWGARTSIGYYSQTLAHLDENRTVLEEVQRTKPMGEDEGRNYLGRFLFSADDVFKTVRMLSGGERSRVALAKLILEEPNVLVLDEPTNHLDIASRDALQKVLSSFEGTLLFVSHDRYLIDVLAPHLWSLQDERLVRYDGTYTDYARGLLKSVDAPGEGQTRPGKAGPSQATLATLQEEAISLASRLAEAGGSLPVAQLHELVERYDELQKEIEEAERAWLQTMRQRTPSFSA